LGGFQPLWLEQNFAGGVAIRLHLFPAAVVAAQRTFFFAGINNPPSFKLPVFIEYYSLCQPKTTCHLYRRF